MTRPMSAVICGTGKYLPERIVTNQDLEKLMETSDEWIRERSGISERRFATAGETAVDMAREASLLALADAGWNTSDIDCLLVATLSPHHYFPGTAAFLHASLGMGTIPAMDIRAQCSGFIYALNVARSFIRSGEYSRILVVGVELQSRGLDLSTAGRDTAVLFGDGAGAVVVEASDDPERGIITTKLHSEGQFAEKLWVQAPSTAYEGVITPEMLEQGMHRPKMDGKFVFKNAVQRLPEVVGSVLGANQLRPADIDLFVFHQANLRINEVVASRLGIPESRIYNNIQKYGNTSAASIPICIDECRKSGRITRGSLVCTAAFGSGFTWGAALIRF